MQQKFLMGRIALPAIMLVVAMTFFSCRSNDPNLCPPDIKQEVMDYVKTYIQ